MNVDAVIFIATLGFLVWKLWWELRNGRTLPFPFAIRAERARQPRLYWSQVAGLVFVTAIVICFAGALIVAMLAKRISN